MMKQCDVCELYFNETHDFNHNEIVCDNCVLTEERIEA